MNRKDIFWEKKSRGRSEFVGGNPEFRSGHRKPDMSLNMDLECHEGRKKRELGFLGEARVWETMMDQCLRPGN